jgi:hypothetical protein
MHVLKARRRVHMYLCMYVCAHTHDRAHTNISSTHMRACVDTLLLHLPSHPTSTRAKPKVAAKAQNVYVSINLCVPARLLRRNVASPGWRGSFRKSAPNAGIRASVSASRSLLVDDSRAIGGWWADGPRERRIGGRAPKVRAAPVVVVCVPGQRRAGDAASVCECVCVCVYVCIHVCVCAYVSILDTCERS